MRVASLTPNRTITSSARYQYRYGQASQNSKRKERGVARQASHSITHAITAEGGQRARLCQANGCRELQHKFSATAYGALHRNASAMCFDYFSSGWQPQPRATVFCRVKRLEHPHSRIIIHTATRIDQIQRPSAQDAFARPIAHHQA